MRHQIIPTEFDQTYNATVIVAIVIIIIIDIIVIIAIVIIIIIDIMVITNIIVIIVIIFIVIMRYQTELNQKLMLGREVSGAKKTCLAFFFWFIQTKKCPLDMHAGQIVIIIESK